MLYPVLLPLTAEQAPTPLNKTYQRERERERASLPERFITLAPNMRLSGEAVFLVSERIQAPCLPSERTFRT